MGKQISPMFAIIVIVVAIALGGLYFAMRYRAHEAEEAAMAAALQMQADAMRESGRMGMGRSPQMRRRSGAGPSARPEAGAEPGGQAASEPEAAGPAGEE